ncbi:hypothetical protein PAPYR_7983 [Paratrimastix pyriformis]|uniref:TPR-like protein n=1 Tax=Paratrimastix pyriformis TaxID=342808 RepID=A0ABQ8UGY8_9EUKA|nr:hypothetical protein PAPYR_7983 [Paratrimastix pyriformis]
MADPATKELAKKAKEDGNVHFKAENYPQAMECYNQARGLDPLVPAYHFNYGLAACHLKEYSKAAESLRTATTLDPDYGKAWLKLAEAEFHLGEWDEASQHFQNASRSIHRLYPTVMADCLHEFVQATEHPRSASDEGDRPHRSDADFIGPREAPRRPDRGDDEIAPTAADWEIPPITAPPRGTWSTPKSRSDVLQKVGEELMRRRNIPSALACFLEARDLDDRSVLHIRLAQAYMTSSGQRDIDNAVKRERLHKALIEVNVALSSSPDLSTGYWLRGNIYNDLDELDQALADFERSLAIRHSVLASIDLQAVKARIRAQEDRLARQMPLISVLRRKCRQPALQRTLAAPPLQETQRMDLSSET